MVVKNILFQSNLQIIYISTTFITLTNQGGGHACRDVGRLGFANPSTWVLNLAKLKAEEGLC